MNEFVNIDDAERERLGLGPRTRPSDPAYALLLDDYTSSSAAEYDDDCYICRDPEFAQMGLPLCTPCPRCQAGGRQGHMPADDPICTICEYDLYDGPWRRRPGARSQPRERRSLMSINIGTIKHKSFGTISLEISNDDEFIKRVKEINRDLPGSHAENMKLWTIRVITTEKIPAKIRHLMEGASGPAPAETEMPESPTEAEIALPLRHSATPPEESAESQQASSAAPSPTSGESAKPKRRVVRRNPGR